MIAPVSIFLLMALVHTKADGGPESSDLRSGNAGNRFGNFRCYTGTGNGIQAPTLCPTYSKGCIKRTITLKNGNIETNRFCGDLERTDVEYSFGCDSFDVPHEQEICYCESDLCNGSIRDEARRFSIILGLISTIMMSSFVVKI